MEPERPNDGAPAPETLTVPIDRFLEIDLRVARVVSAERVANADRLLHLRVELAGEERTIVAGIAASYAPEALVGKTIVIVANLKPARIRGIESRGMLLAAEGASGPIVCTFEQEVPTGTRVR